MAAGRRRQVLRELGDRARATRRSFLLLPGVGQRSVYDDYVIRHRIAAAQQAPELGLAIPERGQPYPSSSLPAQRLARLVQDEEPARVEALEDTLFRAAFVALADVGDAAILKDCARAADLDEALVDRALADESLVGRVLAEHREALALGIQGIPALHVPGRPPITGAVPTFVLRRALAPDCDVV